MQLDQRRMQRQARLPLLECDQVSPIFGAAATRVRKRDVAVVEKVGDFGSVTGVDEGSRGCSGIATQI